MRQTLTRKAEIWLRETTQWTLTNLSYWGSNNLKLVDKFLAWAELIVACPDYFSPASAKNAVWERGWAELGNEICI